MITKYEYVFRSKHVSADRPKIGVPGSVRPGDLLTYFNAHHASITRVVESVHPGHVIVAALVYEGRQLDSSHKVAFEHMHEATRATVEVPQESAGELPTATPPESPTPPESSSSFTDLLEMLSGDAQAQAEPSRGRRRRS